MNITTIDSFKRNLIPRKVKTDNTVKGIILNNYIKKQDSDFDFSDFDDVAQDLLIPEKAVDTENENKEQKSSFDAVKAAKPIAITAACALGAMGLVSLCTNKYSKALANETGFLNPGDLARNINIKEEPHFAMYRFLRDPNGRNALGFMGVGLMSGVTLVLKSLVDGFKDIWIKKQNCDIEYELQENLIQTETDSFSGKMNYVNSLLKESKQYFSNVLSKKQSDPTAFTGSDNEVKKADDNKKSKDKQKNVLLGFLGIAAVLGISAMIFKNYNKTIKNLNTFTRKMSDKEIRINLENAVELPEKQKAIKTVCDILKTVNAKEETMKTHLTKIKGITEEEIQAAIKDIKASQIYAQAPEALGGVSEKIQYYCYIDENRGHLYNWILNPENKFNKYLFLSFCAISSLGYVSSSAADALKTVAVNRENSKSELALRKRLVEVEVNNFKAKKKSAIEPLMEDFRYKCAQGKTKEELRQTAENILREIKNGPPYVYS